MKQLTDLEICKKIAEIEGAVFTIKKGVTPSHEHRVYQTHHNFNDNAINAPLGWFNPLTDDALLTPLMFKHEVTIIWSVKKVMMYKSNSIETVTVPFTDKSKLPKAICLAIIEANKA